MSEYTSVIGISPTGQNFHVTFVFMKDEKIESFIWAQQKVKTLFGEEISPGVIVTDREKALMNAVDEVVPTSAHMLCRRHIAKDVEKHLVDLTKTKKYSPSFCSQWKKVVDTATVAEYELRQSE
ncbi:hypothetical protein Dimus_037820 [Dionaea muscipula]